MAKLNIKSALAGAEAHGAESAVTRTEHVDPKIRVPKGFRMRLNGKLNPPKGLKWPFRNYSIMPITMERVKNTVYCELDSVLINYLINRGIDAIEAEEPGQTVDYADYMEGIFQRDEYDEFRPEYYDGFYVKK